MFADPNDIEDLVVSVHKKPGTGPRQEQLVPLAALMRRQQAEDAIVIEHDRGAANVTTEVAGLQEFVEEQAKLIEGQAQQIAKRDQVISEMADRISALEAEDKRLNSEISNVRSEIDSIEIPVIEIEK